MKTHIDRREAVRSPSEMSVANRLKTKNRGREVNFRVKLCKCIYINPWGEPGSIPSLSSATVYRGEGEINPLRAPISIACMLLYHCLGQTCSFRSIPFHILSSFDADTFLQTRCLETGSSWYLHSNTTILKLKTAESLMPSQSTSL